MSVQITETPQSTPGYSTSAAAANGKNDCKQAEKSQWKLCGRNLLETSLMCDEVHHVIKWTTVNPCPTPTSTTLQLLKSSVHYDVVHESKAMQCSL